MHKLSCLLGLLAATASPVMALTADQKITAVTVYPDRALVTRSGSVQLDSGVQSVVFEHLPLNLEEDSLRAKAQGKLKILGVELRQDYKEVAPNAAVKQLQDAVTKLDDQIRALTDEQWDLGNRRSFLDKMRDKVTADARATKDEPDTVANMQGLFQLYCTEYEKTTIRQRESEFTIRDLNKQRADLANQLNLLQQPAAPNTLTAVVTVDVADAGPADVQVSYLISGAGWQPQYDAYADPDTKKVELTYYGVVRQATGENWDDVALTLSSARPSTVARPAELPAWTIDFGGEMPVAYGNESVEDFQRVKAASRLTTANSASGVALNNQVTDDASVAMPAGAPVEADLATSEVHSLGPAATFTVPMKTSIPNDNQPHRSAISVQTLKGEWTYEATPKLIPSAFLKTKVTNSSGGPLLGGDINAFLGNNYIGKSNIGLVAANASFDLFLGVDENIKVTRTEGLKKEEVGGILTKMKLYERSFTIEVQNFKTTDEVFKLRDQLPVSKNGQISVVVKTAEPPFSSHDEDTGEVIWEIKLKPNEKQKLTVEYEVDAPYDQPVAGI